MTCYEYFVRVFIIFSIFRALLTAGGWNCCPVGKWARCSSWWGSPVRWSGWGGQCSQGLQWTPGETARKQRRHQWRHWAILSSIDLRLSSQKVAQYLCRSKWLEKLQSQEWHERTNVLGKPGGGVQFRVALVVTAWPGGYSQMKKKERRLFSIKWLLVSLALKTYLIVWHCYGGLAPAKFKPVQGVAQLKHTCK